MSSIKLVITLNRRRKVTIETVCQVLALRIETKTLSLPDDGSHGVLKHVGGNFMQLVCIYSSVCGIGFIS